MTSVQNDWDTNVLYEGVYPVLDMNWCKTITELDGTVRLSGSFQIVGDNHCKWYWIDSEKVLIDSTSAGVTIQTREGMGMLNISEINFDHVIGNRLLCTPPVTNAYNPQIIFMYLRLGTGAVGSSLRALDEFIIYSKTRVTFGKPLSERQAIQWEIADMARELKGIRWKLYDAAIRLDDAPYNASEQVLAKLASADAIKIGISNLDRLIQLFGGKGYERSFWLEEAFRNLVGYQTIIQSIQEYKNSGVLVRQRKTLFQ